jgi:DNA-binding transcriptional LysR family regulator
MDRFKQIETFVRVADAGSLAAAALEEGVSPVILGRRIDALEQRLGVKLMYRSTRRLVVSEEGAAFLERCRGLLTEWDQAENELDRRTPRGKRPSDRVGAGCLWPQARRAARASISCRQARFAGVVQPD